MADRIEREIEEILARLDQEVPSPVTSRKPVSIVSARKKKESVAAKAQPASLQSSPVTPAGLLFAGAGTVVGGLIFANFWGPLIWASFAGVVMFIGAFIWSFFRSPRSAGGTSSQGGHYWRDRYISYEPTKGTGAFDRLRRKLRRR